MLTVKRIDDLVRVDQTHRQIYVDPEIFAEEMKKIFSGSWVFVGHESEVAAPGDYKTKVIGRQPVILTRDQNEEVHVLFNRCRHRAALVCREGQGNSARFRCAYHGWTYKNDGELIGVPYRPGYGDAFDASELGLVSVPRLERYRGFLFASLSESVGALPEWLGPARRYLDQYLDRSPVGEIEVARGTQKYAYHGNWKLQLENLYDSYHPAFTHESAFERRKVRTGKGGGFGDAGSENVALGHGHGIIDYSSGELGPRRMDIKIDPDHMKRLEERYGSDGVTRMLSMQHLVLFPNVLFYSVDQSFRVITPVSVDYTEVQVYPYRLKGADPGENDRQIRKVAAWASAAGLGQPDDLEVLERIQEGLQVTSVEWLLFSRGLERERVLPNGEIRGKGADETGVRGMYREYKHLMMAD
jgi:phenylpropionate dioxygenase-like ring-hydroxylating dioxygenase large terminal subunit